VSGPAPRRSEWLAALGWDVLKLSRCASFGEHGTFGSNMPSWSSAPRSLCARSSVPLDDPCRRDVSEAVQPHDAWTARSHGAFSTMISHGEQLANSWYLYLRLAGGAPAAVPRANSHRPRIDLRESAPQIGYKPIHNLRYSHGDRIGTGCLLRQIAERWMRSSWKADPGTAPGWELS
jgi:hypothetical protein